MKRNFWSKFLPVIGIFLILALGYTNCAKQFTTTEAFVETSSSSTSASTDNGSGDAGIFTGDTCDQQLKLLFATGYHNFLRTNCTFCHVNGPGKGQFASPNINDAFNDFMQTGYAKVSDNATSSNHNPPYSGPQHIQTVNELRIEWQGGLTEYSQCKGSTVNIEPHVDLKDLLTLQTTEKTVPALNFGQNTRLEWDLTTELNRIKGTEPLPSIPGAKFSIQVGKYEALGGATYYTFSTPRIYGANVDIRVKTLQVSINSRLLTYATTFRYVDKGIYAGSTNDNTGLVSTGALLAPSAMSSADKISISFEVLEPTELPDPPAPIVAQFNSSAIRWVTPTTGAVDVEIQLSSAPTIPVTVSISSDSSAICAGQTGAFTNVQTCNTSLANFICPSGTTCDTSKLNLGRARNPVGTNFNRFDWDYKFTSGAITFNPNEDRKTVTVIFSKDIRKENNRLLTLQIDANLVNAVRGANSKINFVINKKDNPTPPSGVLTFSELMQSGGVLGFNCVKCHNSRDLNGGYDMTDYESMRQRNVIIPFNIESLMFARMNPSSPQFEGTSPMPIEGALDPDKRKEVENWIKAGAPNN